jgi:hypothetical protein
MAKPWERQPGEAERAYLGFTKYLEIEPVTNRSLINAYMAYRELIRGAETEADLDSQPDMAPAYFRAWSSNNRWLERARLYDNDKIRREHEAVMRVAAQNKLKWAQRRERIADRDYDQGEAIRAKIDEMLRFPLVKQTITREQESPDGRTVIQNITIEPVNFNMAQAASMLKLASERQRLAADMATEIVETTTPADQAMRRLQDARATFAEGIQQWPGLDRMQFAQQIAQAFGVSAEDLLEGTDLAAPLALPEASPELEPETPDLGCVGEAALSELDRLAALGTGNDEGDAPVDPIAAVIPVDSGEDEVE